MTTTHEETLNRVVAYARNDDRVRAVYLDGSRVDPTVTNDAFQDFDLAFVVTDVLSFIADPGWISAFGDVAMVQESYKSEYGWGEKADDRHRYAWLFILSNGIRIDLQLDSVETGVSGFQNDALREILIDKDDMLPAAASPSNRGFWAAKPTEDQYMSCCNEFWWCLNNVGKATARGQYPFAVADLQDPVRDMLIQMLGWYVGSQHEWQVAIGKRGKFLHLLLTPEEYARYLDTFPRATSDDLWNSIDAITSLFRDIATSVADACDFRYPRHWDTPMVRFLHALRGGQLPGEMNLNHG